MAEALNDGLVSLQRAIGWHLQSNHYPPVPTVMNAPALAAIEALNEDDGDRLIDLPEGVEFRDGRTSVEAHVLAESFHLYGFVNDDLDWFAALDLDDES
jgi:hypothetical protein